MEKLPIRANLALGNNFTFGIPFVMRQYDKDTWTVEVKVNYENISYSLSDMTTAVLLIRGQNGTELARVDGTVSGKRLKFTLPEECLTVQQKLYMRVEMYSESKEMLAHSSSFFIYVGRSLLTNPKYVKSGLILEDTNGKAILTPDKKTYISVDGYKHLSS